MLLVSYPSAPNSASHAIVQSISKFLSLFMGIHHAASSNLFSRSFRFAQSYPSASSSSKSSSTLIH